LRLTIAIATVTAAVQSNKVYPPRNYTTLRSNSICAVDKRYSLCDKSWGMKLTFLVKGSAAQPYEVSFWRNEKNLTTSCTCEAGTKGTYCKHRFALMEADVTNLVSGNIGDIGHLQQMIMDTDVSEAYEPVRSAFSAQYFISSKFLLKPEQRRKRIDTSATISLLQSGGIMKGNGGANYLDVYDKDNKYLGSIKTPLSVFKTDIKKLIPGVSLYSIVRTDKQIHESSQGIYYYMEGSEFDKAVRAEVGLKEAKQRLRAVMKD
jgi:hypothetical protein